MIFNYKCIKNLIFQNFFLNVGNDFINAPVEKVV